MLLSSSTSFGLLRFIQGFLDVPAFPLLSALPLKGYTVGLSIHQLVDIWIVLRFGAVLKDVATSIHVQSSLWTNVISLE